MGAQTLPYDERPRRSKETEPTTFETLTAVTPRGFELKIVWFVLAFAIQCL